MNKNFVIGFVLALFMCLLFAVPVSAEPEDNTYIPSYESTRYPLATEEDFLDLPVEDWYDIYWNDAENWGYWEHDSELGRYVVQAHCLDSHLSDPFIGQRFYRDGNKLFPYSGQNIYQSQGIDAVIDKEEPEPKDYSLFCPMLGKSVSGECTCYCYNVEGYLNGQLVFVEKLLPYPQLNYFDYFLNMYANTGDEFTVRFTWCGSPDKNPSSDKWFEYARVLIKCDGKDQSIIYADENGWLYRPIVCDDLNGTADCRFTYELVACPLCRAKHNGTDPILE